jgi:hypothetical protein
MPTRTINEPFVANVVGEDAEGRPIVGTAGSGDVSGAVAAMVDAHAAATAGVHGVVAPAAVESTSGAQAKATAAQAAAEATAAAALAVHAAAADPHATAAGYARKSVANVFGANQALSVNQNATTHLQVSNITSGSAATAGVQLISDPNAVGGTRSFEVRLRSEGHATDPGVAQLNGTNVPGLLVSLARGTTTGTESVRVTLGAQEMLALLRLVTTNRRIASFFAATPPDTGGDEVVYIDNAAAAPTASALGAFLWAVAGVLTTHALETTGAATFGGTATFLDQFEALGGLFDGDVLFNAQLQHQGTHAGFFGVAAATQPAALADLATDGSATSAQIATKVNAILAALRTLGLIDT